MKVLYIVVGVLAVTVCVFAGAKSLSKHKPIPFTVEEHPDVIRLMKIMNGEMKRVKHKPIPFVVEEHPAVLKLLERDN